MKNFPHQASQLHLIRGALVVIRDLSNSNYDVSDDGILGYELTRRGVYMFRRFEGDLEARIAVELAKTTGNQGPRTAARDYRRTLRYLSFLDSQLHLTLEGHQFLRTAEGSPAERAIWHIALLGVAVPDRADQFSHPVRILLRLIEHFGRLMREELALALEPANDTEVEFERVIQLVPIQSAITSNLLRVSEHQRRNAEKILPSLAEQTGLIARQGSNLPYTLTDAGRDALHAAFEAGPINVGPRSRGTALRRRGGVRTLPQDLIIPQAPEVNGWNTLTADDQVAASRLRFERTARHQTTLGRLADPLRMNFRLFEGTASFDLVVLREDRPQEALVLFEIKTLESDAATQARLAVGQLVYYEYFVVSRNWAGRSVRKAAVFDGTIDHELASFLNALDIAAFECGGNELHPLNSAAEELRRFLDAP